MPSVTVLTLLTINLIPKSELSTSVAIILIIPYASVIAVGSGVVTIIASSAAEIKDKTLSETPAPVSTIIISAKDKSSKSSINEVKSALEGMLSPLISEKLVATIEIRDIFKVPKVGTVAGCYVQDGKINRNNKIRLFREGVVIYEGQLATLKRFKDDVKEVDAGYECGLNIANFNDIKVNDIIESYEMVETKQKLES